MCLSGPDKGCRVVPTLPAPLGRVISEQRKPRSWNWSASRTPIGVCFMNPLMPLSKIYTLHQLDYCCRAFSIACTTWSLSGFTCGSNLATILPCRSTRNLLKFHFISPPYSGFEALSVRYLYSGSMSSPFTDILENIGKVTLYFAEQKLLISALVPGSWKPKLLAGNPNITRPCCWYFR